jgi:hypothetical protein
MPLGPVGQPRLKWSALKYGFWAGRTDEMAKRPKPEEIVAKLRQAAVLVSQGAERS